MAVLIQVKIKKPKKRKRSDLALVKALRDQRGRRK